MAERPGTIDTRLRRLSELSAGYERPWPRVDMAPAAIRRRLETLAQLCDLCAALPRAPSPRTPA